MPRLQVRAAILSHPQVGGQCEDRQAEHKVARVKPIEMVDQCEMHHLVAGHEETGRHRDEHRPFALDEYRGRGEQCAASHDNRQHQSGDHVIAERRALYLLLKWTNALSTYLARSYLRAMMI